MPASVTSRRPRQRPCPPRGAALARSYHESADQPGALPDLGDGHASQCDTELTGTAAETKATVRVHPELVKKKRIPWLRIEKPDSIVSVYADKPLEAAVE